MGWIFFGNCIAQIEYTNMWLASLTYLQSMSKNLFLKCTVDSLYSTNIKFLILEWKFHCFILFQKKRTNFRMTNNISKNFQFSPIVGTCQSAGIRYSCEVTFFSAEIWRQSGNFRVTLYVSEDVEIEVSVSNFISYSKMKVTDW